MSKTAKSILSVVMVAITLCMFPLITHAINDMTKSYELFTYTSENGVYYDSATHEAIVYMSYNGVVAPPVYKDSLNSIVSVTARDYEDVYATRIIPKGEYHYEGGGTNSQYIIAVGGIDSVTGSNITGNIVITFKTYAPSESGVENFPGVTAILYIIPVLGLIAVLYRLGMFDMLTNSHIDD